MQLKGSTFIVTGGASGLGEGTVKMLAEAGANVVIADLQADKGEALAKQLGQKARFVRCDVTSEADGQAAVDAALKNFNALQGLVNCVGMTLPIARDLSRDGIRVCTIAPGIFETPMLLGMPKEVQEALAKQVPFPPRLGKPADYAQLVRHIVENEMLNGETIRLDGAIRMAPKRRRICFILLPAVREPSRGSGYGQQPLGLW